MISNFHVAHLMPTWRLTDSNRAERNLRAVAVIALHHFMS